MRKDRTETMRLLRRTGILVILFLFISMIMTSCSSSVGNDAAVDFAKSQDDKAWQTPSTDMLTLSNVKTLFEFDTKTGHFKVTNRLNGKQYSSVPTDTTSSSEGTTNRLSSELSIRYFDTYSKAYDMYSTKDSVSNDGMAVLYNGNKIRVNYSFGAISSDIFNPMVLTADAYENSIVPKLTGVNARHIGLYYTLYSNTDNNEDFQLMLKKYPQLANENLYILNQNLSTTAKNEIEEIMSIAGYTKEIYESTLKKIGITETVSSEPGFIVPVEYELEDDGFTATVLTDKVKETINTFKLQQIDLLEYFACTGEGVSGQFLVPDGSGALIKMNSEVEGNYSQTYYGNDYSMLTKKASQLSQTAHLPVFGIINSSDGIFAIAEGAESVATLTVRTKGFVYPQNTAFISYAYRTKDVVVNSQLAGGESTKGEYNVYCESALTELPSVRFALMEGEGATYSGMAVYYRNYLLSKGTLTKNKDKNNAVYLDFNCIISDNKSVLGFSYDKKITLSTIKDISTFVQSLHEKGVNSIVVRLNGYGSDGLSHGMNRSFQLDKSVGTVEEMRSLAKLLASKGGGLYLNADFQFVYKSNLFDGFSKRSDSAYYLDRSTVQRGDHDVVTREYSSISLVGTFLSPNRYYDIAKSFLKTLVNKIGNDTPVHISYNTVGHALGGDYNMNKNINRTISQKYIEKTLKEVAGNSKSLMTDGGNGYVLPYTAHILNMPTNSSEFDLETQSIPFYQIVVHGSISYTGRAYNQSSDTKDYILNMVEYGANPYFVLTNSDDKLLVGTEYNTKLYSLNSEEWVSTLTSLNNELSNYYAAIDKAYISKHEQLLPGVYSTSFENGVRAIVNYNNHPATVEGITVDEGSYYISKPSKK